MFIDTRNRRSVLFAATVVGLSFSFAPAAQAEEPLRWKFEVGEKFDYDTTQDMTLTMKGGPLPQGMVTNVQQQMDMTWDVEAVNEVDPALVDSFKKLVEAENKRLAEQGVDVDSADFSSINQAMAQVIEAPGGSEQAASGRSDLLKAMNFFVQEAQRRENEPVATKKLDAADQTAVKKHRMGLESIVGEIKANGGEAVIRQKVDRVRMKMTGPMGKVDYDSDSEEAPTGMAAMWAPMFDAMTQGNFEITMTSRGEVKDVKIPEELLTALKNSPGGQGMGAMNAEGFKKMLAQGALVLPAEAPQEGESWTTTIDVNNPMAGKQTVETTYTYDGTKEIDGTNYAVFKPELKMNFEGNANLQMKIKEQSSDGEVLFNVDEGRLSSSTLEQNVKMDVTVGGASMEQTIDQTIEVEVTPAGEESEAEASEDQEAEAAPEE